MVMNAGKHISIRMILRVVIQAVFGLAVVALVWACAGISGVREEAISSVIRVPFVRVLLSETSNATTIGADNSFSIECVSRGTQQVFFSGRPVEVSLENGRLSVDNNRQEEIASGMDEVNIIPRGSGNRLHLGDKRYRGLLKIAPSGQTLRVINILYMEDYLRGVVPPEIGPRINEEIEAIKAQAVAARTYTMAHLKQYGEEPYDMKAGVTDQVYEGADAEVKLVDRAVEETVGRVAMFQDDFINAYYHSTCGRMTDNIEAVWDKKEQPYLKSVDDSSACSWSKYFNWQETYTEPQLRARVEQYLTTEKGREIHLGRILGVTSDQRTAGGRVAKLSIRTEEDVYHFFKDRIRWVFGRTSSPNLILPSDRFTVNLDHDAQGIATQITVSGQGYGHGVGMCQCGAIGLSRKGYTFDKILSVYYTGVNIKQLY
jgi:stage II sporulation protein D